VAWRERGIDLAGTLASTDSTAPSPAGRSAAARAWLVPALLTAPTVVFLIAFFVVPSLQLMTLSVTAKSEAGVLVPQFGIENYLRLWEVDLYRRVLLRTLRVAILTSVICIPVAYPLAIVLVRGNRWVAQALALIVIAPLLVNVVIRAYGWTLILNRQGLLNWTLKGLGLAENPGQLLYTEAAVIIASVHVFLPFMVLPLAAAIARIDPALDEAASVLGAPGWRRFLRITLPLSLPGLAVGTTLVFSVTAAAFVTPQLLGGNFASLLGTLIEQQVLTVHDWPFGAALATVLVAIVLATNLIYLRFVERRFRAWTDGGTP
jgi:putative spermidine/putrescine transport system permease protein